MKTYSTPHKLYGFPSLMKAGLGNMLLPWADCYLWCKDHNAEMIAPFWSKLRIGPYLRREKDKRHYQRLFNTQGLLSGVKRLILLCTVETCNYESLDNVASLESDTIVKFSSMECMNRLIGRHAEVKQMLVSMTLPHYLPTPCNESFIGIHVRLGDYAQPGSGVPKWLSRLPIEWYVTTLNHVREVLSSNIKAVVFSDGLDSELAPLLKLENVERSPFCEAITDILFMSQASVIIGSCSTFSTWGVYLSGNASAIWYRGRRPSKIYDEGKSSVLEAECEIGEKLPDLFVARLKKVLACP